MKLFTCELGFKKFNGINSELVCVSLFYVRHRFNRVPDPPPRDRLGVTYLPFAFSSDAGYADLPLALLGAPVDIGALVKTWVTVSWQGQDRDWQAALPGQDCMYPFGLIGAALRYIPAGAVSELAGIKLSCTSTTTSIRKKHRRGESDSGSLIPWWSRITSGFRVTYPVVVPNGEPFRQKSPGDCTQPLLNQYQTWMVCIHKNQCKSWSMRRCVYIE